MAEAAKTMDDGNKEQFVPLSEVQKLIDDALNKREAEHQEAIAAALATAHPGNLVPAHSGGPGSNRHQRSWSLAEQEASLRGETLDHWV